MGTNFYLNGKHIGKRSGSGLYCFKCGISLINYAYDIRNNKYLYGRDAIHVGNANWNEQCPICGDSLNSENTQISTSCSFTWAMNPMKFFLNVDCEDKKIKDENEKQVPKEVFREILNETVFHFFRIEGVEGYEWS